MPKYGRGKGGKKKEPKGEGDVKQAEGGSRLFSGQLSIRANYEEQKELTVLRYSVKVCQSRLGNSEPVSAQPPPDHDEEGFTAWCQQQSARIDGARRIEDTEQIKITEMITPKNCSEQD